MCYVPFHGNDPHGNVQIASAPAQHDVLISGQKGHMMLDGILIPKSRWSDNTALPNVILLTIVQPTQTFLETNVYQGYGMSKVERCFWSSEFT